MTPSLALSNNIAIDADACDTYFGCKYFLVTDNRHMLERRASDRCLIILLYPSRMPRKQVILESSIVEVARRIFLSRASMVSFSSMLRHRMALMSRVELDMPLDCLISNTTTHNRCRPTIIASYVMRYRPRQEPMD